MPEPARGHFHDAYRGTPPWDIGAPQPALARLVDEGTIAGKVLDVGCGTGELALHLAARGCEVWGVDIVPAAVERARAKAAERRLEVTWRVHDALDLGTLGESFDAVVDSGLFHVVSDADRPRFAASLSRVLRLGGEYWMLVFSEDEPTDWGGPRRVTQDEIRATFGGWRIASIEAARFATRLEGVAGHAWLAHIEKTV